MKKINRKHSRVALIRSLQKLNLSEVRIDNNRDFHLYLFPKSINSFDKLNCYCGTYFISNVNFHELFNVKSRFSKKKIEFEEKVKYIIK